MIGTPHVDCQLGDGLPAETVLGLPHAEIADLDRAAAIVLLGPDLEEELPVLHLRVRRAAIELRVPLVDLAPTGHALTEHATLVHRLVPGEQHAAAGVLSARLPELTEGRDGPVVVVLGRGSLSESAAHTVRAAAALAALPNVLFLSALRRGNVHGALDAGLAPGFLPGRVSSADGGAWFTDLWGQVSDGVGHDATGILQDAADGRVQMLVLLGADPVNDFPDSELAQRAIDTVPYVVAVDAFLTESTRRADAFLPCTLWGEKSGHVTNLEGRIQRVNRKVAPEGTAMDDWRIATELALRLGTDFDFATVDEVTDEMARVSPAHLGVTSELLRRARDGVVLPLRDHAGEIVVRAGALSILAEDGAAASWDPIKVEGAEPVDAEVAVEDVAAEAPALFVWDRAVPDTASPGRDAYALRLVVGRTLYDAGVAVTRTDVFEHLPAPPRLRVSPADLARIGVEMGSEVRITSARASISLPVVADESVPAGVAVIPFTADSDGAAMLIDATASVTDVRVETKR